MTALLRLRDDSINRGLRTQNLCAVIELHMHVEAVAVNQQQTAAVGGDMCQLFENFHRPEAVANKLAHGFIMIAWHIHNTCATFCLLHDQSQHIVMRRWPDELALQRTEIDDIAEQVQGFTFDTLQKIEQILGTTVLVAQMNIREPYRANGVSARKKWLY